MIGTVGADTLLLAYLAFVAILGIVAGGVTSYVLKKRWGVWWGAADAGLAVVGAVLAALIITKLDESGRAWESPIWVVFTAGVATVVGVHLLQGRVLPQSGRTS